MNTILQILFGHKFYGAEMCIGILAALAMGFYPARWLTIVVYAVLTWVFALLVKAHLGGKR